MALWTAIRRADVVPSDRCNNCGHDFSEHPREGHHHDHNFPLDVEWLCRPCHDKRHLAPWVDAETHQRRAEAMRATERTRIHPMHEAIKVNGRPRRLCSCSGCIARARDVVVVASARRRRRGLEPVRDILRDILEVEAPTDPPPSPHPFDPACPCEDCMRTYLRSVEGKGETA